MTKATEQHLASLDLLRGLAAFAVAIPHYLLLNHPSRAWETASVVAVEIFFVLSGFVLAPQILKCAFEGFPALRIFLVRRWMRTVPPYLFALLVVSFLAGKLFGADFWRYALYVQNLFAQHNTDDYYPVAWSLSIEEWFYVTFPLALVLFLGIRGRPTLKRIVALALAYIAIVSIARLLFGQTADWGPSIRRVVVFRVDSIAYGFLLWLALSRRAFTLGTLVSAIAFAGSAGLAFVCVTFAGDHASLAQAFPFAAAACGASAIAFFRCCEPLLRAWPTSAVALFLGRISYSVYLFHLPVAIILYDAIKNAPLGAQLVVFLAVTCSFCAGFYRFFERPILEARPRYKPSNWSAMPPSGEAAQASTGA